MDKTAKKIYSDDLTVRDGLQLYFSKYHFENGGYDLKWFRIKVGRLFIPLPNTKDRVKAVKIHDIHHLITEYEANLRGEAQIAGWEIASGCGGYYVAWLLNMGSFFYGMFFFPRAMHTAFMRGRRARTNFYHDTVYDDVLLRKTLGMLRGIVEPNEAAKNVAVDYWHFAGWCILILILATAFFAGICLVLALLF